VRFVVSRLLRDGRIQRSYLGLAGQKAVVTRSMARHHGVAIASAVRVMSVESPSPASAAGFRERDLIIAFDDQPVNGIDDLHRHLTQERIGRPTPVTVLRGPDRLQLIVVPWEDRSERH
jgi:S1-C subfamily serine protease